MEPGAPTLTLAQRLQIALAEIKGVERRVRLVKQEVARALEEAEAAGNRQPEEAHEHAHSD